MKIKLRIQSSAIFAMAALAGFALAPASAQDARPAAGGAPKTNDAPKPPQVAGYRDVPPGHWAADAVNQMSGMGVIEGHPGGKFDGHMPVTRYEWVLSQSRIFKCNFGPPPDYAVRQELKQALERLDALEKTVKALEEKLKAVPSAASLPGTADVGK